MLTKDTVEILEESAILLHKISNKSNDIDELFEINQMIRKIHDLLLLRKVPKINYENNI